MKAQQIIRSEKLGSPGPPGVFVPQGVLERRGIQAVTRGTGILAQNLAEFGAMIQTSVRRDMVSHNYALAQRDIADAELNLKADPDHRSVPGKFSSALDDIRAKYADQILDPVARNMFQRKMFEYGTTREIQMKYHTWNRENEAQQAHLIEELDIKAGLIEQLDTNDLTTYRIYLEESNDVINQTVAGGHMQAGAGAKLKIGFREESAKKRAAKAVKSNPFDTLAKLSAKGWGKTFPFLSDLERLGYMDDAQTRINQINKAADQEERQEEADQKQLDERMRELTRKDFIKRIEAPNVDNPLSPMEVIDNPNLEAKDIEHFLKVMKAKAAAELKDSKSVYDETNETLYGAWKERIYLRPESIEDLDDIWADHGKGLSTTNVSELSKLWEDRTKPGKEEKNLALQRAVKTLGKMRDLGMFGNIKDEDELLEAHTKHNNYVSAVEIQVAQHPEWGDKEIMDYVAEITEDDQKSSTWDNIWKTFQFGLPWYIRPPDEITGLLPGFLGRPGEVAGPSVRKPIVDEKRQRAIDTLNANNKEVNEDSIKRMMEMQK